jgi:hypothetical protein
MSCLKLFSPEVDLPEYSTRPALRVFFGEDDPVHETPSHGLDAPETVCVLRMTPPCPACGEVSLEISSTSDHDSAPPAHGNQYPRLWSNDDETPSLAPVRACQCRRCDHTWSAPHTAETATHTAAMRPRLAVLN